LTSTELVLRTPHDSTRQQVTNVINDEHQQNDHCKGLSGY
jgi:hypothetical protein